MQLKNFRVKYIGDEDKVKCDVCPERRKGQERKEHAKGR